MVTKIVMDKVLGPIEFPQGDSVMAPFISDHGEWEPEESRWLRKVTSRGSICLNVGANVGYFAKWMSRLCGPEGHVIAVEPNPNLIPLLLRNLELEEHQNYEILDMAAGGPNSRGVVDLYLNEKNNGDNRLFDPTQVEVGHDHMWYGFDSVPKTVSVRINSLDRELSQKRLDVVLIDTQGWDFEVIEGLAITLKKWRPHVLMEFTPSWLEARGLSPLESLQSTLKLGYRLACPDLNITKSLLPKELLEVLSGKPDLDHVNVVLIPKRSVLVGFRRMRKGLRRPASKANSRSA